jgi:hypothetical protein
MERRDSKRYDQKAFASCRYFNCPNPCNGKLINYSKRGMCFETNGLFKEKTTVMVSLNLDSWEKIDSETLEGLRSISIGEVIRCQEIADDQYPHYEIGIQYY